MKIKKLLIAFAGIILLLTTPCLAQEISVTQDIETSKVTVEANLGEEFKNRKLMLYCLLDKGTISEIPEATDAVQKTDKIYAISYGESDNDGKYTFSDIIVNGENAKYVFYVTVSESSKVYKSESKYIVNRSSVDDFLAGITNAAAEDILAVINDEVTNKTIGLNILLYENLNDNGREQAAVSLENREFDGIGEAVAEINRVSVKAGLENINTAKSLDLLLYPDDYSELADFIEIIKSENGMSEYEDNLAFANLSKLEAAARIRILNNAIDIESTDDLFDKIIISVINYEISNCAGYGDITGIIKAYYENGILAELNFNTYNKSKYRNSLNKILLDKTFDNVSELISYIENYIARAGTQTGPSSSSGGGGGGNASPSIKPNLGGGQAVIITKPETADKVTFSDMSGYDWAVPAVEYLGEKGIISGKGNGLFDPSGYITREEFVKIIVYAFDIKKSDEKAEFADVKTGAWYEEYVSSAVNAGIVNGISKDEFGAGKNVTRQDVAVMICRALSAPMQNVNTDFIDDSIISEYAKASVVWMCDNGYISGYEDKSFRPTNFCTRAEAAKIIYEIIN